MSTETGDAAKAAAALAAALYPKAECDEDQTLLEPKREDEVLQKEDDKEQKKSAKMETELMDLEALSRLKDLDHAAEASEDLSCEVAQALEETLERIREAIATSSEKRPSPSQEAVEIIPGMLLLGCGPQALSVEWLRANGIKQVVNITPRRGQSAQAFAAAKIEYKELLYQQEDDFGDAPSVLKDFQAAWDVIERAKPTLIYCQQKAERSLAMVLAVYLRHQRDSTSVSASNTEVLLMSLLEIASKTGQEVANHAIQRQLMLFVFLGMTWPRIAADLWQFPEERFHRELMKSVCEFLSAAKEAKVQIPSWVALEQLRNECVPVEKRSLDTFSVTLDTLRMASRHIDTLPSRSMPNPAKEVPSKKLPSKAPAPSSTAQCAAMRKGQGKGGEGNGLLPLPRPRGALPSPRPGGGLAARPALPRQPDTPSVPEAAEPQTGDQRPKRALPTPRAPPGVRAPLVRREAAVRSTSATGGSNKDDDDYDTWGDWKAEHASTKPSVTPRQQADAPNLRTVPAKAKPGSPRPAAQAAQSAGAATARSRSSARRPSHEGEDDDDTWGDWKAEHAAPASASTSPGSAVTSGQHAGAAAFIRSSTTRSPVVARTKLAMPSAGSGERRRSSTATNNDDDDDTWGDWKAEHASASSSNQQRVNTAQNSYRSGANTAPARSRISLALFSAWRARAGDRKPADKSPPSESSQQYVWKQGKVNLDWSPSSMSLPRKEYMTLKKDEHILVREGLEEGWAFGLSTKTGLRGWFPPSFVEVSEEVGAQQANRATAWHQKWQRKLNRKLQRQEQRERDPQPRNPKRKRSEMSAEELTRKERHRMRQQYKRLSNLREKQAKGKSLHRSEEDQMVALHRKFQRCKGLEQLLKEEQRRGSLTNEEENRITAMMDKFAPQMMSLRKPGS